MSTSFANISKLSAHSILPRSKSSLTGTLCDKIIVEIFELGLPALINKETAL